VRAGSFILAMARLNTPARMSRRHPALQPELHGKTGPPHLRPARIIRQRVATCEELRFLTGDLQPLDLGPIDLLRPQLLDPVAHLARADLQASRANDLPS
jgi:hypothetical protein